MKLSLFISFLNLILLMLFGSFVYVTFVPSEEPLVGDELVFQNEIYPNDSLDCYLIIETDAQKPTFYLSSINHIKINPVSYKDGLAHFKVAFLSSGNKKLKLYYRDENIALVKPYQIKVYENRSIPEFNFFNDEQFLYVDASNSVSHLPITKYFVRFNTLDKDSETPFFKFPLPNDYGIYPIHLTVYDTYSHRSISKNYIRSYKPVDIDVTVNNDKHLQLNVSKKAEFNFNLKTVYKTFSPLNGNDSPQQKVDEIQEFESTFTPKSMVLDEFDIIDTISIALKLSVLNLSDKSLVNFYVSENASNSEFDIPENSIVECRVHVIKDNLFYFEPLTITLNNDYDTVHEISGQITFNNQKYCALNELGKTLHFKSHLSIKK